MNKHYPAIAVLTAVFIAFSGSALAQHGDGMHIEMMRSGMKNPDKDQQQFVGQGMADNIAMMSSLMHDIHQMMVRGPMTNEHHKQMMSMINRMGCMMEEMTGPHGAHVEQPHSHELHEMGSRLEGLKAELQGQGGKPGLSQE